MNERVSIIMPNYNCEKFIEETINSVLAQTYENWELLIIDDCSTDNSVKIIRNYCDKDSRIKLFMNESNSGAAVSRNLGLREATGKWIAFLDSDDVWVSDKLQKQIAFMNEHNYHFSYTMYEEIDEDSHSLHRVVGGPKKITKRRMYNYCWIGCLTAMYDAECIGVIQIADLKKNNDYAQWLKVSQKAACYLMPEVAAKYRKRSGSISNHSKASLIKYHYYLFKDGEGMGKIRAAYYTCKNLFYGVLKKLKYVKKIKPGKRG